MTLNIYILITQKSLYFFQIVYIGHQISIRLTVYMLIFDITFLNKHLWSFREKKNCLLRGGFSSYLFRRAPTHSTGNKHIEVLLQVQPTQPSTCVYSNFNLAGYSSLFWSQRGNFNWIVLIFDWLQCCIKKWPIVEVTKEVWGTRMDCCSERRIGPSFSFCLFVSFFVWLFWFWSNVRMTTLDWIHGNR